MSQQYTLAAVTVFAVVAYVPSMHSLTPERCFQIPPPVIQHIAQPTVESGPRAAVPVQHASAEPSPCHARRQRHQPAQER